MLSDRMLFERLDAFSLDDAAATFKFSHRLAQENRWSLAFAKDAVREYKKFVYLAATSPTPVTPSDVIDQVWHLHLTYTRSYWNDMCGAILRKPLHHGPTQGGAQEDSRYRNLYDATLAAYRSEFDAEPPRAFWPDGDARFAARHRWVDLRTSFVVSHRAMTRAVAIAAGVFMLGFGSSAFAASKAGASMAIWPIAMLGGFAAAIIGIAALAGGKRRVHGDRSGDGGTIYVPGTDSHHGHGHGHGHGGEGSSGHDGGGGGHGCSGGGCSGGGGGCSSS